MQPFTGVRFCGTPQEMHQTPLNSVFVVLGREPRTSHPQEEESALPLNSSQDLSLLSFNRLSQKPDFVQTKYSRHISNLGSLTRMLKNIKSKTIIH